MRKPVWAYKCLFGFKHYWSTKVGNVGLRVEMPTTRHLPRWTAFRGDKVIARSLDFDTVFQNVDAAMDGAEKWAAENQ